MFQKELSLIDDHASRGAELRIGFFKENSRIMLDVAGCIAASLVKGGKVLICGNGGSAADAQHMAAEFVGRFRFDRPALPAVALTTDTSILTAVANDYSFKDVFSRQVKALGREGDVLIGFSTSGRSRNVLEAIKVAKEKEIITVGITGKKGGGMMEMCDYNLHVPCDSTPLVQEIHITIAHLLCELVEVFIFESVEKLDLYM